MWSLFRKHGNSAALGAADESRRIYCSQLWPYRLLGNFILLLSIGFACLGFIIVQSNFVPQKLNSLSDYLYRFTTKLGFTVDDILVYGRDRTSLDEINNIVNSRYGDNILRIDIHQLKDEIKQLPWIKEVTISRSYSPNLLKIYLKEKEVSALWQYNNHFLPLDADSEVINTEYVPDQPLLLVVGRDAPAHLNELLSVIRQDASLFARVKAVNYISGRRWNILLDDPEDGITIKLPHEKADEAWEKLVKLNKTKGILKRKLTIIDLRFADKVLVKPRKNSGKISESGKDNSI